MGPPLLTVLLLGQLGKAPPAYHGYEDLSRDLARLEREFPEVASLVEIGSSIEGRKIWALKLSVRPQEEEGEPRILLLGGIHARERLSVEVPYQLARRLCHFYREAENSLDSESLAASVKNLLDHCELWLVPLLNPDGLEYSRVADSSWRKNRRPHGDGSFGVDLNRNWSVGWKPGSDTESQYYPGTAPFSEPETDALRAFLLSLPPGALRGALSFHSYGQFFLHPWAYTDNAALPGRERLEAVGGDLALQVRAATGRIYQVRQAWEYSGLAGGTALDWLFSSFGIPAYAVELPPQTEGEGGFLPPPSEIGRASEEMLAVLLRFLEHTLFLHGGWTALHVAGYDAQFISYTVWAGIGLPRAILPGGKFQEFFVGNLFRDEGSHAADPGLLAGQDHNLGFGNFSKEGILLLRPRSEEMARRGWEPEPPFPPDVPEEIFQLVTVETFGQDEDPSSCYDWGCAGPLWYDAGIGGAFWPHEGPAEAWLAEGAVLLAEGEKDGFALSFRGAAYPTGIPGGREGAAQLWIVRGILREGAGRRGKASLQRGVVELGNEPGSVRLRLGSGYFRDAAFTPRADTVDRVFGPERWARIEIDR